MDFAGFRSWKYNRTGAGKEWTSIDSDSFSDRYFVQSIGWKVNAP